MEGKHIFKKFIKDYPKFFLFFANILPLFGAVYSDWNLFYLLFLYWLESGIVGLYNIIKIIICPNSGLETGKNSVNWGITAIKQFIIIFFVIHFSGFMYGHLAFITILFNPKGFLQSTSLIDTVLIFEALKNVWLFALVLMLSKGFSFYQNYLLKGEYAKTTVKELLYSPYQRIFTMHFIIIFGGFLLMLLTIAFPKLQSISFFLFVIIKLFIDYRAHNKEHEKFEGVKPSAHP